jgi:putative ABC transport system permease protein
MLRNLFRNRATTLLLLLSLSIGISVFIYISARVVYNKSFDTHFENFENVYRVVSSTYREGELILSQPLSQRLLGETLKADYPEVKRSGFLCIAMSNHYTIEEIPLTNDYSFHCSNGFIELFSIQITGGRTDGLLTRPNMVIISESFAHKYYGENDPVGKTIQQYPRHIFEIEAVFKDLPENSHFNPDILISFHDNMRLPPPLKENWGEFSFYTYLELDSRSDVGMLEDGITHLCSEKNQKLILDSESEYKFSLQAIGDIHTKSQLNNEISQNVRGDYLNILYMISIFILIISGFNYVYFSYTRISGSSLQYGLKKTFGAGFKSLFTQFLIESLVIHTLAVLIAILGLEIFQHLPIELDGYQGIKELPPRFWLNLLLILALSALVNPLIILMLLNKKSALSLLSKEREAHHKTFSFKQIFTIIQFAIIVFLISAIFGISRQVNFLRTKDKGIDITDKLVIKTPSNIRRTSQRINNLDAFEEDLTNIAGIRHVSVSNITPGDTPAFSFNISEQQVGSGIKTALFIADSSYLKSYDINILEGKGLSRSGSDVCVINITCMRLLGYDHPEDVIDRTIYLRDESGMQNIESRVSGVCEDFNFSNVKEVPGPFVLLDWTENFMWGRYTLAFDHQMNKQALVSQVESRFTTTFPNYPFEYYWLEDYFNKQFDEELSIIKSLKAFALISVLLGVLSLLSMVWHISQARTKEIGIRKANGASALDIIRLLNRHFVKWIGIASLISLPLAWYFLSNWLSSFEYRIHISIWIFIISSAGALFISSLTVTLQSLKVARMNPLDSIKYE